MESFVYLEKLDPEFYIKGLLANHVMLPLIRADQDSPATLVVVQ